VDRHSERVVPCFESRLTEEQDVAGPGAFGLGDRAGQLIRLARRSDNGTLCIENPSDDGEVCTEALAVAVEL
jgi:hypothetical protein